MKKIMKKFGSYLKNEPKVDIDPLVIVDVGCRWGFADKFVKQNDAYPMRIFGFDPDAEECKRLESMYDDNIRLVPLGLADKPGKRVLYLTQEPACSSLYKPSARLTEHYPALACAKKVDEVEVEVSTLNIWSKEEGLEYIDYMKIDTQGAELSILQGATDLLPSIRFLEIEVEFNAIYEGQPLFSDIDLFLRKHGFVLWKFSNFVHYSQDKESEIILENDSINYDHHRLEHEVRGGQLHWADAFYVKQNIVETAYDGDCLSDIQRDAQIAKLLGFLDLKDRLDKAYAELKAS